jgi:hypothetical protein
MIRTDCGGWYSEERIAANHYQYQDLADLRYCRKYEGEKRIHLNLTKWIVFTGVGCLEVGHRPTLPVPAGSGLL